MELSAIEMLTGANAAVLLGVVWRASAWTASMGSRVKAMENAMDKRSERDGKLFSKIEELHVDLASLTTEVNGLRGRFDRMDERR